MVALTWNPNARPYFAGIDHGVLYLPGFSGMVWNGLVSVEEISDGYKATDLYLDGINYGIIKDSEDFKLNVSAYTYPSEFKDFIGYDDSFDQQRHKYFGFSYRVSNAGKGQIHLIYNAIATFSDRKSKTLSNNPEASLFEFDISTTPEFLSSIKPTAHVIFEPDKVYGPTLTALLNTLYGTSSTNPSMPSLSALYQMFEDTSAFQITDNGDGTWTARGSSSAVQMLDTTTFQLSWPTVTVIDANSYTMSTDL